MQVSQKRNKSLQENTVPRRTSGAQLTEKDFEFFQSHLLQKCGIFLPESKSAMVQSRLQKRLSQLGYSTYSEYCTYLGSKKIPDGPLLQGNFDSDIKNEWQFVINSLTTHTTEWFREMDHFTELREEIIPRWLSKKTNRPLRIWSAASSTGKEAYSIALVLNYFQQKTDFKYEITATDIDTDVLSIAQNGLYAVDDLSKIPEEYHTNALAKGVNLSSHLMKVRKHIRDNVNFTQLNLVHFPYQFNHQFDLIFCRNILIYFSPEIIEKVAHEMYRCAAPDSMLITGHSESFTDLSVPWEFIKPTYYKKSQRSL
jgi:chemotaxis protein methyltransferase CheR